MWLWQKFLNLCGLLVGLAEFIGFRYPVKEYRMRVDDNLWRGSRVGEAELKDLTNKGFKLVINLCAENNLDAEIIESKNIQIAHFRIPVIDNTAPTNEQALTFLRHVTNKNWCPAYVHCEAGVGRTSVFVSVYEMAVLEMSCLASIEDAKKRGMKMPDQEDFLKHFFLDFIAHGNWREAMNASAID